MIKAYELADIENDYEKITGRKATAGIKYINGKHICLVEDSETGKYVGHAWETGFDLNYYFSKKIFREGVK